MDESFALPDARDPNLHLTHPSTSEFNRVYSLSFVSWGDALTLPQYLEESMYLTTVPLAKNDGMRIWILVDKNLDPDKRPILCSCETFRKRAFVSDTNGRFSEAVIYGIASVFCDPKYRRRGYASRLMQELATMLPSWEAESGKCVGSVLYSDIGKTYYARLGWHPFPINSHMELDPSLGTWPSQVRKLQTKDLGRLCEDDGAKVRNEMIRTSSRKIRMMIVPDLDHMLWHISKEEFACDKLFRKVPETKGAMVGEPGSRIWAVWTHRYYGAPDGSSSDNTLYILRFVVENPVMGADRQDIQTQNVLAILHAARIQAAEWGLDSVKFWDAPYVVQRAVEQADVQHRKVNREEDGIASLLWFGEGSGKEDSLEWLSGQKFAWL